MTPWEWLVLPDARILVLGEDPALRRHVVGTTRAMPAHWARTLGMWRVAPAERIAAVAEVGMPALRMYAARHGLLWKTETRILACDLAAEVCRCVETYGPGTERFRYAARRLGIHDAEARLYVDQAAVMFDALGVRTAAEYDCVAPQDPGERARMWAAAPALLEVPDEARPPA